MFTRSMAKKIMENPKKSMNENEFKNMSSSNVMTRSVSKRFMKNPDELIEIEKSIQIDYNQFHFKNMKRKKYVYGLIDKISKTPKNRDKCVIASHYFDCLLDTDLHDALKSRVLRQILVKKYLEFYPWHPELLSVYAPLFYQKFVLLRDLYNSK
jgi:hypothetical protein